MLGNPNTLRNESLTAGLKLHEVTCRAAGTRVPLCVTSGIIYTVHTYCRDLPATIRTRLLPKTLDKFLQSEFELKTPLLSPSDVETPLCFGGVAVRLMFFDVARFLTMAPGVLLVLSFALGRLTVRGK